MRSWEEDRCSLSTFPTLLKAMTTSKPAREPPFEVIPTRNLDPNVHGAVKVAIQMILVHNCFIRAFNSIYYHAPYVKEPQDVRDFLHFVAITVESVDGHHDNEENYIYPQWARDTNCPALLDVNKAEHESFHDGLMRLGQYANTTDASSYKSEDLLAILDGFSSGLVVHLSNEIETLLDMQKYDSDAALRAFKAGTDKAMDGMDKYEELPFLLGSHDRTFEDDKHAFPPIPRIVARALMWWYGGRYVGTWRFCPCDLNGWPKKPEFGPDAM